MTNQTKFEMHCVVELSNHQQIAGKVTEQAIGGATFIRIDVPTTSQRAGFTKFYGPGAIYAITPVEQAIAQAMAEGLNEAPIQEWRLKTVAPSHQLPPDDDAAPASPPPDSQNGRDQDRHAAAQWARELLSTGGFVIFDTETTGFEDHDEIIQIGIIDQGGNTVLDRLIKPGQPILNSRYHGITDEMVKDAPAFPAVYKQIKAAFDGKTVLAYNWDYDARMLAQVCRKHDLAPVLGVPDVSGNCVMEWYAQFNGEWNDYYGNYRWKKLREALAAFGLKHEDFGAKEHDATTDAKATLAVIRKMAEWQPEASER